MPESQVPPMYAALMEDLDGLPFAVGPLDHVQDKPAAIAAWLQVHNYGTNRGTVVFHHDVVNILPQPDREAYRLTVDEVTPKPLTTIGPTQKVSSDELVPGRVIQRYTEPVGTKSVTAEVTTAMPCCQRKINLDVPAQPYAMCCGCRNLFTVRLHKESDGGHMAVFTLALPVAVAIHRNAR